MNGRILVGEKGAEIEALSGFWGRGAKFERRGVVWLADVLHESNTDQSVRSVNPQNALFCIFRENGLLDLIIMANYQKGGLLPGNAYAFLYTSLGQGKIT